MYANVLDVSYWLRLDVQSLILERHMLMSQM